MDARIFVLIFVFIIKELYAFSGLEVKFQVTTMREIAPITKVLVFEEINWVWVLHMVFQTASSCNFAALISKASTKYSNILVAKKMNKFVCTLLLALLFSACQDTPKSASEPPAETTNIPAAPAMAAPEDLERAASTLASNVQRMEDLRKQADAVPDKIRKANTTVMDEMYAALEGMIEKQTQMINDIKGTANPAEKSSDAQETGSTTVDVNTLKDYTESAERYAQEAKIIEESLAKMAAGNK